jgi:hypothetical protein
VWKQVLSLLARLDQNDPETPPATNLLVGLFASSELAGEGDPGRVPEAWQGRGRPLGEHSHEPAGAAPHGVNGEQVIERIRPVGRVRDEHGWGKRRLLRILVHAPAQLRPGCRVTAAPTLARQLREKKPLWPGIWDFRRQAKEQCASRRRNGLVQD